MVLIIYELSVPNLDETTLQRVIPRLPVSIQKKIASYRFLHQKWQALLSALLARKALATELKTPLNSLKIEVDGFGKPFLTNYSRHFNISHAGNMIVMVTDDSAVGIDIEAIRPLDDLKDLLTNFSKDEQEHFSSMNGEGKVDYFYKLWTLKESYLKAIGKGFSIPLQSFSLKITDNEIILSNAIDVAKWNFKSYEVTNQYKCAVCAQHRAFPDSFVVVRAQDLLNLVI